MRIALYLVGGFALLSVVGMAAGRWLRRDGEAWRRLDPRLRVWPGEEPTRLDRLRAIARAQQDEREQ